MNELSKLYTMLAGFDELGMFMRRWHWECGVWWSPTHAAKGASWMGHPAGLLADRRIGRAFSPRRLSGCVPRPARELALVLWPGLG